MRSQRTNSFDSSTYDQNPRKSQSMSTSVLWNKKVKNGQKQRFRNAHSTTSYITNNSSKKGVGRGKGRRILSNFSSFLSNSITSTSVGDVLLNKFTERDRYEFLTCQRVQGCRIGDEIGFKTPNRYFYWFFPIFFRIRLQFNVTDSGILARLRDFFIRSPTWSKYRKQS